MKRFSLMLFTVLVFIGLNAPQAMALPEFAKAFKAKYTDKDKEPDYSTLVRKAGCNLCHIKGEKDKHKRNAYGDELAKLIEGDAKHRKDDVKDADEETKKAFKEQLAKEIDEALDKAAALKNADGETYGELIKEKKLPTPIVEKDDSDSEDDKEGEHDEEPKDE